MIYLTVESFMESVARILWMWVNLETASETLPATHPFHPSKPCPPITLPNDNMLLLHDLVLLDTLLPEHFLFFLLNLSIDLCAL